MTGKEILTAIQRADAKDEMWSLIVQHDDRRLELHTWEHHASALASPDAVYGIVRECLLSLEPVECDAAATAGLAVLNSCNRCERH